MGRRKFENKKIENVNSRQVTFSKRKKGLFKKGKELAILCDADVAFILFSNTGKLYEFSSSSMKRILSRYNKCLEGKHVPAEESTSEGQPSETDVLKEEIENLKLKQIQLLGEDLMGMGLPELYALERQLNDGLWCIKEQKENVLMQQLEQRRTQEHLAALKNENLRRQVEEFRAFLPSTSSPSPLCMEYPSGVKIGSPVVKEGSGSPEMACNSGFNDDLRSDTSLHLAPPNGIYCQKKEAPH